jgi:ABC-type iron transport system FetAB ATPase subunit
LDIGVPKYRTLVQYIPQRPPLLPGTPLDFLNTCKSFASRDKEVLHNPLELAAGWGVDKTLWMRDWGTLSGGEGQRIAMAIAIGLGGAEVLLLDGEFKLGGD